MDPNAGTITGTPTAATTGASSFTVQVIDAKGIAATKQFSITFAAAGLTITTAAGLPNATTGLAYSATLSAAGCTVLDLSLAAAGASIGRSV